MNNLQSKLKALGIYQIIGGLVGIFLTLFMIDFSNLNVLLLVIFAFLLFGYSIYCGVLVLRKAKNGLWHSKVNQILQVVHFVILGYGFKYASGLFITVGFDLTDGFLFTFNLGTSSWLININTGDDSMLVSLNFVALFLIVLIDKWQKGLNVKEMEETIQRIGQEIEPVNNH